MSDIRRASRSSRNGRAPDMSSMVRALTASSSSETVGASSLIHPLTAAVQFMTPDATGGGLINRVGMNEAWQEESWDFYEALGEFNYGVTWFSEALSRCRLNVAELMPGGDEPEVITSGAATDIIEQLAGGTDGQSAMLASFGVQLSTPGECYLVGRNVNDQPELEPYTYMMLDAEPDETGHVWSVQPTNTIRKSQRSFKDMLTGRGRKTWDIRVDDALWVPMSPESLVVRIFERNERLPWRASSAARAALPVMREIDMYNRYIMATLVSRVALNGILLMPEEIVLPVNPAYEDQQDPFFMELLDIMRAVIKNPGSPASAAPLPLRVPAEYIDSFKHLTFATPLDGQIYEARKGAIVRLAASLNLPQEVLTGMGSTNHWCVTPDTEIMTADGWKTYQDVSVGDEVLTLNHETGLSEWQPTDDIVEFDVTDEKMLSMEGRYHSSMTTMSHRWPILHEEMESGVTSPQRRWITSDSFVGADRIIAGAPHGQLPQEAKYTDAFVELVGWFFTEGTCRYQKKNQNWPPQVLIGQSHKTNFDKVLRIRSAFTALYGPPVADNDPELAKKMRSDTPQWRERVYDTGMTLFTPNKAAAAPLLSVAPHRVVGLGFVRELTAAQLELFLLSAASGDGVVNKSDGVRISQRAPERLAAVELAGILAGRAVLSTERMSTGFTKAPLHLQSILPRQRTFVKPKSLTKEVITYTGKVWCPVTPNGSWLARRNGRVFYTGNSAYQLEESAIKIHIAPKIETVTRCLTVGYLYPMLRAVNEPLVGPHGGRIIVWYDTSQLTQRPDRSEIGVTMNKDVLVNDVAARREAGFSESDAPSEEEQKDQLLRSLILGGGPLAGPAYKQLTGEELEIPPPPAPMGGVPLGAPNSGPGGAPGGKPTAGTSPIGKQNGARDALKAPDTQGDKAPTVDKSNGS